MKKHFLILFLLFGETVCSAQDLTGRKYFCYADSVFEVGEVKILGSYEFNCWSVGKYVTPLDSVYYFLTQHPEIGIEISIHTDSKGKSDFNQMFSQIRADSLVFYLIAKGIDAFRVTGKGYGNLIPRVVEIHADGSDCESCRMKNRRTEIKIIYNDFMQPGGYRLLCPSIYMTDPLIIPWEGIPSKYENAEDMKKKSPK